ncbi:hypothetical protein DSO57_1024824 [Entomophthora muscae]|uniref:Uncharacterized protein n=1 Tax=Entomophthora muscae TaxID=34485 RepID=A0ACC2TE03_9FUNG|nr:hypothetical protein DSO57_1024824 [Entomophthora muscae]
MSFIGFSGQSMLEIPTAEAGQAKAPEIKAETPGAELECLNQLGHTQVGIDMTPRLYKLW